VPELLLELLSEEIPARMQRRAIEDLVQHLREWLQVHRIPAAEPIRGYVTPRRLTVIADGIPERLPLRQEERRGPRLGAPQAAIDGFLRSVGAAAIEDCEVRDTGRGEFYFAKIERAGHATGEVLPDLIYSTLMDVAWPKTMRFPATALGWVRPINSVVCLFNGEVVSLSLGAIPVGRTTRGHRFLSPGEIAVDNATYYLDRLEAAYVILDQDRRRDIIAADLDRVARSEGLSVKPDPALLDEVTGLVEFPVVLIGAIEADFMALPPEVLATAMRAHQKYFSCLRPDGTPAPRFLFVANNLATDGGKTIIAGNERVLKARLADARFFWDQDRRTTLESRVEALSQRVYHEKLGDLLFKAERIERLAAFLARFVPDADAMRAGHAARLAKADLSTGMVGEFPELQGIMGRYYALHNGEDARVAAAIADHYKPLGPNDMCPSAPDSVVVALADKVDALVGFFGAANKKPTGSRDPFALRRAAQGIIRLVLENRIRLPLTEAFRYSFETWWSGRESGHWITTGSPRFTGLGPFGIIEPTQDLLSFIAERLKVHLRGEGFGYTSDDGGQAVKLLHIRHDLIAAVFARAEDDLVRLLTRAAELAAFIASEDGVNLLTAHRRASNIVEIEERRDGRAYDGEVDPMLLRQPEERALVDRLDEVSSRAGTLLADEEFERAMTELARLRRPIDDFFDRVTVNCDEAALRENRLRLLSRIRATLDQVADFSQIEG
jgi:glycyl-tRNA synthetase beta chain